MIQSCYNITCLTASSSDHDRHPYRYASPKPASARLSAACFLCHPRFCGAGRCRSDLGRHRLGAGVVLVADALLPATHAAIELEEVCLGWRDKMAVRDLTGSFSKGSLTAVVGPNGAGKSTLLRGIMGWVSPLAGRIRLASEQGDAPAFMPQQGDFDRSFPISTRDFVAMGAWRRVGPWRAFGGGERDRLDAALQAVGLADFGRRPLATLSGGQLQRALFARLMLHDASTYMLDEPFSAVDRATTEDLMALLMEWHGRNKTVIVVLHDLDLVRRHFPQTLLLAGQGVAWGETGEVLTPENLHLARHLCAGDYL